MQAWGKQTWKQDSSSILGPPSHPVGWSHSPKGHTVENLDPKALGIGCSNITHEVGPEEGPLQRNKQWAQHETNFTLINKHKH